MNAELGSWPNVIAWVAGHTHVHRIRPFVVDKGVGSNGDLSVPMQLAKAHSLACAALYLFDPDAVRAGISEASMAALCQQDGTRDALAKDRNVEWMFAFPQFWPGAATKK